MFRRRNKQKIHHRARDFLWPSLGWRRSTVYLFHRIARLPGSSYSIAAGFACGAAISFTPFVGLHFILGGICAWMIRAHILASAIGTAVGNPWTFPFIWTWIYNLGIWMGAGGDGEDAGSLNFSAIFARCSEALLNFNPAYLFDTAWPILWPMLVGSLPTFIVVWFVFYLPLRPIIATYQHRRLQRRMRRIIAEKKMNVEPET